MDQHKRDVVSIKQEADPKALEVGKMKYAFG